MPSVPLPRLPLAGVALAAAAGIFAADYLSPAPGLLAAAALLALVVAVRRGSSAAVWIAATCVFGAAHVWQWQQNPARGRAQMLSSEPRRVAVTGILVDEPQPLSRSGEAGTWRALMRAEKWEVPGTRAAAGDSVLVRWTTPHTPGCGDRWRIEGVPTRPAPPRNPGEFDAADWWARKDVFLEVRGRSEDASEILGRSQGARLKSAALATRDWMLHVLGLDLDDAPQIRALVAGVALGARDTESEELADAFRQTGTFHLFSVSGLHVGMFAMLAWLVLRPLGFSRRTSVFVIVPLLFFYSLVTGASAPSLRAALMISVAFGGVLIGRANAPANSLAAAALLLLGWDTNQLFSPGFQLSFFIVASIFLLAPPMQRFFTARLRPDPFLPRKLYTRVQKMSADAGHALGSTLGVSAAAWLGSLPLTAAVFHLLPVLAIPANMLAVPLSFGILAVAMLSLVAGAASAWAAAVFNNTNWGLGSLLAAAVQGTAALPGAYVYLPPAWLQPSAQLTVFDLGTGGAQLFRTRQSAWLFDTGSEKDFTGIVEPNLRAAGIGTLDTLVATHGDNEHLGGSIACLREARPRRLVESVLRDRSPARRNLHTAYRAMSGAKTLVLPGDVFTAGTDSSVEILHPAPDQAGRRADDQSIVAAINTGGFRILLMSDAGAATEEALISRPAPALRSDILVLGRHGEDICATESFLAAVQPRVVVLARADPFREGSDETSLRARLAATGAKVFDQAESGAVTVTFAGGRADARSFLGDAAIQLAPR